MQQEVKAILTAEDRGYTSTMKSALGVTETFAQKIKNGIGFGILMRAGQKAFDVIGNAITSNLSGATKRFDTLNNFPKVMQSLGHTAEDADKSMSKLANSIDHLPTTLDKVASQTQSVVAVVGDLEKATDLTLALNNAMAGGGAPAEQQASAINQWVQAMAKGKPDMQDWRAMVQTAPAQMDQLSKALLGATANQSDLYQAMQSGKISIEEVNDAMIELSKNGGEGFASWEEQAKNASAGIQMAMVNVKASIQRNLANIMDAIDQAMSKVGGISGVISSVIPAVNSLGDTIASMVSGATSLESGLISIMNGIGKGLRGFVSTGGDIIANAVEGMASAMPELIEQASVIFSNISYEIASKLPSLISSGAKLIGGIAKGLISGIPQIAQGITKVLSTLTSTVSEKATSFISNGLTLAVGLSQKLREGAGQIVDAGMQLVKSLAQGFADALPAIIENVPQIVTNIAGIINDNAPKLLMTALNIIKTLGLGLIQAIPTLIANIPAIIGAIWNAFTAFNWLSLGSSIITAIKNGLVTFGENLPTTLQSIGTKAWNAIKNINWGNVGSTIVKFIVNGIKALIGLPSQMLHKAGSMAMKAFTGIAWGNVGTDIVRGIVRGVTAGASMLFNALKNLASRALESAKSALGIGSPSKVMNKEVGRWIPAGLAQGIQQNTRLVTNAMNDLVSIPEQTFGNPNYALTTDYEYGVSARYEVIVPVQLNGREIARATAGDMQTVLNQRETRQNRKVGIR